MLQEMVDALRDPGRQPTALHCARLIKLGFEKAAEHGYALAKGRLGLLHVSSYR